MLVMFYGMTMTKPGTGNEVAVMAKYLASKFMLGPLIGGLGMMVIGLFVLFTAGKKVGCGHDHSHDHDHDHDHEHGDLNPIVALLVVCLPLGVAVGSTKHELSSAGKSKLSENELDAKSVMQSGLELPKFTRETLDKYKEKNANGAYKMQVMELFLTAGDPEVSKVLEGLPVEVEGAVRTQPDDRENPKVKRMYRLSMTCCAADMQAIPIKLVLNDDVAEAYDFEEHTWVIAEGKVTYETDDKGIKKTIIQVEKLEQGIPPDHEILQGGGSNVIQNKR